MGILTIPISWIKEYDCRNGKVKCHVTQLQNWHDWTTKAEVEWSQIAKKGNKKIHCFCWGLFQGLIILCSNSLKKSWGPLAQMFWNFNSSGNGTPCIIIRNIFVLALKFSYVKAKEFTMRELFHERRIRKLTYFKMYLRSGDKLKQDFSKPIINEGTKKAFRIFFFAEMNILLTR